MLCNDVHESSVGLSSTTNPKPRGKPYVHVCKLEVLTGTHIDQDAQHVHVCGGTWWDV